MNETVKHGRRGRHWTITKVERFIDVLYSSTQTTRGKRRPRDDAGRRQKNRSDTNILDGEQCIA